MADYNNQMKLINDNSFKNDLKFIYEYQQKINRWRNYVEFFQKDEAYVDYYPDVVDDQLDKNLIDVKPIREKVANIVFHVIALKDLFGPELLWSPRQAKELMFEWNTSLVPWITEQNKLFKINKEKCNFNQWTVKDKKINAKNFKKMNSLDNQIDTRRQMHEKLELKHSCFLNKKPKIFFTMEDEKKKEHRMQPSYFKTKDWLVALFCGQFIVDMDEKFLQWINFLKNRYPDGKIIQECTHWLDDELIYFKDLFNVNKWINKGKNPRLLLMFLYYILIYDTEIPINSQLLKFIMVKFGTMLNKSIRCSFSVSKNRTIIGLAGLFFFTYTSEFGKHNLLDVFKEKINNIKLKNMLLSPNPNLKLFYSYNLLFYHFSCRVGFVDTLYDVKIKQFKSLPLSKWYIKHNLKEAVATMKENRLMEEYADCWYGPFSVTAYFIRYFEGLYYYLITSNNSIKYRIDQNDIMVNSDVPLGSIDIYNACLGGDLTLAFFEGHTTNEDQTINPIKRQRENYNHTVIGFFMALRDQEIRLRSHTKQKIEKKNQMWMMHTNVDYLYLNPLTDKQKINEKKYYMLSMQELREKSRCIMDDWLFTYLTTIEYGQFKHIQIQKIFDKEGINFNIVDFLKFVDSFNSITAFLDSTSIESKREEWRKSRDILNKHMVNLHFKYPNEIDRPGQNVVINGMEHMQIYANDKQRSVLEAKDFIEWLIGDKEKNFLGSIQNYNLDIWFVAIGTLDLSILQEKLTYNKMEDKEKHIKKEKLWKIINKYQNLKHSLVLYGIFEDVEEAKDVSIKEVLVLKKQNLSMLDYMNKNLSLETQRELKKMQKESETTVKNNKDRKSKKEIKKRDDRNDKKIKRELTRNVGKRRDQGYKGYRDINYNKKEVEIEETEGVDFVEQGKEAEERMGRFMREVSKQGEKEKEEEERKEWEEENKRNML